jgi:hypothetical protein
MLSLPKVFKYFLPLLIASQRPRLRPERCKFNPSTNTVVNRITKKMHDTMQLRHNTMFHQQHCLISFDLSGKRNLRNEIKFDFQVLLRASVCAKEYVAFVALKQMR